MSSASERRNSQFKHGGAARAHRGFSDEEIARMEAGPSDGGSLSDEEIAALESSPPADDRDEYEKGAGWALNILDTITPSWGDEIVAAPAALWGGYDEAVGKARKIQQRYREHEPWDSSRNLGSTALGIVGGLAPATKAYQGVRGLLRVPTGGKAAQTLLGRGAQATGALAGTGALYSEINQTGDVEGGIPERLAAIGEGGVAVPLMGATLGVAGGALGGAVAGGGRVAGNIIRGVVAPRRQAARYLAEKLDDAGQTVDDLGRSYDDAAATGKPVVLADVGPQGVKGVAGDVARAPGPGKDTAQKVITQRQEGQVGRVTEDLSEAAGGKPGTFTQTADDLAAQRADEAKPLYDRALGGNKPVKSQKIVEITNRPSGKSALQRGLKIAQDEGIPESELVIRDGKGNVVGYSAKALHYMKMGLDDMIESARRSGDNSAARAYTIMKNELLGEMDRAIPGYRQARDVFAGHSANKRALELGRDAANPSTHPDEIAKTLAGMSQGEREFFRRGFVQRIIEQVENAPDKGNAVGRIFGNTAKRARLRAVLGDEEYAKLAKRFGVEEQMYGTYQQANVGSPTAERIAIRDDLDSFVLGQSPAVAQGFVGSMVSGTIMPLIRAIGMDGLARLLRGIPVRVRAHISKMLFSSDPAQVKAALRAIAKEWKHVQSAKQRTDATIASLGTTDEGQTAGVAAGTTAYGYSPVQPF